MFAELSEKLDKKREAELRQQAQAGGYTVLEIGGLWQVKKAGRDFEVARCAAESDAVRVAYALSVAFPAK